MASVQMVNIDGTWYKAETPIVKRMGEYYEQLVTACKLVEILTAEGRKLREAQKEYFRTRDGNILRKSKSLEKEFDDLLAGKVKQEDTQGELFR